MAEIKRGTILKGVGGWYHVAEDRSGAVYKCNASGRLRLGEFVPAAGDLVTFEMSGEEGYITEILPRSNFLLRPAIANLDRLFILASQAPPVTDPYLIDKLTVISFYNRIEPVVVLMKCDLHRSEELYGAYAGSGIKLVRASSVSGEGVEEVRELMRNKTSAFAGNSGIGKSSLLNRIDNSFSLTVGDISEKIERGRHTTRHVELFSLENGGFAADTPGFSSFDITKMCDIDKLQLQYFFPEIEPFAGSCRFSDCVHLKEPGCAVTEAVRSGQISASRYESYAKLYGELALIKAWQN